MTLWDTRHWIESNVSLWHAALFYAVAIVAVAYFSWKWK